MATVFERTGSTVFAIAVVCTVAPDVCAEPQSTAQQLFDEARRLAKIGDYRAACSKFAESWQLDRAGGTLMNLAACHERIGLTATAYSEFNEALDLANHDQRSDRVDEAHRRLEELAPQLARLVVSTAHAAFGVRVEIDGRPLDASSLGVPIPVDPGVHQIRATAADHTPWVQETPVAPSAQVRVEIPALVSAIVAPAAPPRAEAPAPTGPPTSFVAGCTLTAVSAAALAVGAFYGFQAASQKHESDVACQGGCSPAGVASLHDANVSAWVSDVGFGVGLAAIGAATYFFLDAHAKPTPRSSVHYTFTAGKAWTLGAVVAF